MAGCELTVEGASKSFSVGMGTPVNALIDVGIRVREGEFLAIVGHNGSGKSTFLKAIAGEVRIDAGEFKLGIDNRVFDLDTLPAWRRAQHVVQVVQDPASGSVPDMTVEENLSMVRLLGKRPSWLRARRPANEDDDGSALFTDEILGEHLKKKAYELSHGLRQMLALHLAFMRRPRLFLLDEHTASLDRANASKCMKLTREMWEKTGMTILMVTHDLGQALNYAERIVVFGEGRICYDLELSKQPQMSEIDLFGIIQESGS